MAIVTADVVIDTNVLVPKGATLVGTSEGISGQRLTISWDTLTISGRGSLRVEASTFGADKRPGLPLRIVGSAGGRSDFQDVALNTAGRLADRALGDDVLSEVGRRALEVATPSESSSSDEPQAPAVVPAGTSFFVFVQQPF
jgi:hypothetical protein